MSIIERTVILPTSREFQKKYQTKFDPTAEFRTVNMKGGIRFDNYITSTKGVIVGPRSPTGLRWAAFRRSKNDNATVPRVKLCGGITPDGEIVDKACFVHVVVAFTYLDRMSWNALPTWILEEWPTYSKNLQNLLLTETFEVDHIDGNSWNADINNLQFMLGSDNIKKGGINPNIGGANCTGENHWTARDAYRTGYQENE